METDQLVLAIKQEFVRRVLDESFNRIRKCIDMLSQDELWNRLSDETMSVGNQVLHIHGNTSQYILKGLGGKEFERKRDDEFKDHKDLTTETFHFLLNKLEEDVRMVIETLRPDELMRIRPVQVFEESGLSIMTHVIEHTSYHTGQITLLTKLMTGKETGYYEGFNL